MQWDLAIAKRAARDLESLSSVDRKRIDRAFEAMRADPFAGDIKFIQGAAGTLRRRVGPWRIFFSVDIAKRTVMILTVVRRTTTTYR